MQSGATAGLCVDLSLFPIDTIKTRLQSVQHGIHRSAGSLRLFAGLPAVLIGSAPGASSAATFFLTYEAVKQTTRSAGWESVSSSITAACLAEVAACIVRVPCEVLKQRAQNSPNLVVRRLFLQIIRTEGLRGLYRGYTSTVLREVPFSFIQFPLWEHLKLFFIARNRLNDHRDPPPFSYSTDPHMLSFWQSALCGSLSGGIAGALTTPLDVAKTRIMLAETHNPLASGSIFGAFKAVFCESGFPGLFAGLVPRVAYLSLGGAIFLGVYDVAGCFWNGFLHAEPQGLR
ncbi:solute carrier family 25 (mitochondrial S-adenosylmethionine transporter), member 26 [Paragonimus westermani]|uniref:Solute carrier family 25 (Mitochondrial S-adenosylmethionine transporter), member 26 n=1 Tax=Paragonimus westermani TaxID=34504 RepID=A0A5J4P287_9TREM|nr:solute carrier family 25 (mitochondrial S-adenosylmethionine transporter), member 26 [Paragonimus westermani]